MYNSEKYVGECLDSILAQTFQDFEVIVVDDCSTDKSCDVVESYIQKFAKRGVLLQLIRLENNSGYAGIPRNIGIQWACGEYLAFADSDDAITKTALEELYSIAKKFDADVVSCEKWFQTPINGNLNDKDKLKVNAPPTMKFVDKPTLLSNDIHERLNKLNQLRFVWSACMKLIRRKFIIEKNIKFEGMSGEDMLLTSCLILSDSKYVCVPNIMYFYRIHEKSLMHSEQNELNKVATKWLNALVRGFKYFNEFLNRQNVFQKNSELKYVALEVVVREFSNYLLRFYAKFSPHQIYDLLRREFEKSENVVELTAFLFGRMSIFNVNLIQQQNLIRQQQAQIQQLQAQIQQAQQQQQQSTFSVNTEDVFKL